MSKWVVAFCVGAMTMVAGAQRTVDPVLEKQFEAAVAAYDAGRFPDAKAALEKLLPKTPMSFEVHELLGLTYASLSLDDKAIEQLQAAVRLKPGSAEAHTNLATSMIHAGRKDAAGAEFERAVALEPKDYTANHDLGEFYLQAGKIAEALPYLERAQEAQPNYDNGYDLAEAEFVTNHLAEARRVIGAVMPMHETGELHNLLAQVDEKDGQYVAAENEFEKAAHLDPSEDNLFDWGSELMLHRTNEPATEVYLKASEMYPKSARVLIGLGMAYYGRGLYEDAVKALLAAVDLGGNDPRCFLFLSKAYDSSPTQAGAVIERFKRYAEVEPNNALAQYYYAMSLWKGKRTEDAAVDLSEVEALLEKAIALDGNLAEPHMQLGSLYADQHAYAKSIPEFERALALNENLPDAHYRLGTDYVRTGRKEDAQKEFAIYQKQRADHLAEVDKERAAVQQFVYDSKASGAAKP